MTAQRRRGRKYYIGSHDTVVTDMTVVHEITASANAGDATTLFRADVHRHAFADDASLADFKPGRLTTVAQVLWRSAKRRKRIDRAISTDPRVADDIHMSSQLAVWTDNDVRADNAVGTDGGALTDHSAVFNPRGWIDPAHGPLFADIAMDVQRYCGG